MGQLTSYGAAQELVSKFRRSRFDLWGSIGQENWVFRGHSNAEWALLPSAWRPVSQKLFRSIKDARRPYVRGVIPKIKTIGTRFINLLEVEDGAIEAAILQTYAEFRLAQAFSKLRSNNFAASPWTLENYEWLKINNILKVEQNWLKFPADDHIALCQHHGLPTRLIDCTYNPLLALGFCVFDEQNIDKDGHVYALRVDKLPRVGSVPAVARVRGDSSRDDFIFRQRSLHTFVQLADVHFMNEGHWPDQFSMLRDSGVPLHEIKIEKKLKRQVAKLLWAEGVDPVRLWPSLDGVGAAARVWATMFPGDHWFFDE